ncbi:MAG: UDP-N-acetylglucosamine 2-epimerase [Planctomycetes bacterium RBG_16_43_13]|nr:MAG: UDP-N-acetylglucosamine 2-epimerase [Planctomycetes bacterium RBG_16_43_13]
MKIAPILRAIHQHNSSPLAKEVCIESLLVHTGQHYDYEMSKVFFKDLDLPEPEIYLEIGSGTHGEQTGKVIIEFEKVLFKEKPDLVIVVGDVNSTMACTLAAAKLEIPVAHVEAGLRSFDRSMPEEINRIVTDALSTFLFTPSADGDENLIKEGIAKNKIFRVGNVMVDSLLTHKEKAIESKILQTLGLQKNRPYVLLTLHRPSNVDDQESFSKIVEALTVISKKLPVIFPVHPRTKKQIDSFGLQNIFQSMDSSSGIGNTGIYCTTPMGYLDFMKLEMSSTLVMTDSGGVQEETTALGVPCLTLRNTTERPVTVSEGTNTMVWNNTEKIIEEAFRIMNGGARKGTIPELWDGKTAERIVNILMEAYLNET